MSERDAKVLAQVSVDDGAEAGELVLVLDDLKYGHEDLEDAWLDLLCVNLERSLAYTRQIFGVFGF